MLPFLLLLGAWSTRSSGSHAFVFTGVCFFISIEEERCWREATYLYGSSELDFSCPFLLPRIHCQLYRQALLCKSRNSLVWSAALANRNHWAVLALNLDDWDYEHAYQIMRLACSFGWSVSASWHLLRLVNHQADMNYIRHTYHMGTPSHNNWIYFSVRIDRFASRL